MDEGSRGTDRVDRCDGQVAFIRHDVVVVDLNGIVREQLLFEQGMKRMPSGNPLDAPKSGYALCIGPAGPEGERVAKVPHSIC